jgi:hypothetical protein
MADIADLIDVYRLLAVINGGATLAGQRTWLLTTFTTRGTGADAGGFQPGSSSFEGGSFSGAFRGSSEEDRAVALMKAIRDIDAEIAAAAAGEVAPAQTAVLLPRVVTSPR